jgi:hypothetical protein
MLIQIREFEIVQSFAGSFGIDHSIITEFN